MRAMSNDKICVGAIAGGFGVKGEVRIKSFCAEPADIRKYSPLSDSKNGTFTMKSIRAIKDGYAARFEEIANKEVADALKGTRLFASREKFPELEEDEYYHSDLIGLMAFDGNGEQIGKVKALQNYGAGDLLELHFGTKTVLIPFTRQVVPLVDLASGKIVIDPPEGLFD